MLRIYVVSDVGLEIKPGGFRHAHDGWHYFENNFAFRQRFWRTSNVRCRGDHVECVVPCSLCLGIEQRVSKCGVVFLSCRLFVIGHVVKDRKRAQLFKGP